MEQLIIPALFISTILIISLASIVSYRIGKKDKLAGKAENSEVISTSIFGLLALFVSFSYSMAVTRYEQRRGLAIKEANAISTAYLRGTLLKSIPGMNLKELYRKYLESRIKFYDDYYSETELINNKAIQKEMENHLKLATTEERGALESAYTYAFTEMIDTSNARNFALMKTLPLPIYIIIVLIATAGFCSFNYDRGFKNEASHWKLLTFIILFSVIFTLIFDIDHANRGIIRIGQDALIGLRHSL